MENGKRAKRFTFNGFKQVWQELQKQYPSRHVISTEIQNEWKTVLDNAGIDPELFTYQIKMNHREGGADDLFRFDSHDEFIDFLLELVLDPSLGDTVRKNIEKHRDDIRRSKNRLRPERLMVDGLISRLSPMKDIAAERQQLRVTAGDCSGRLAAVTNFVAERILYHGRIAKEQAEIYERELELAAEAEEQAKQLRRHAATLRLFAATEQHHRAKSEDEVNQSRLKKANRQVKIWEAAIPLRNAMRFERNAAEHRAAIQQARVEHQPLHDTLTATADRYAAALQARVNELKQLETDCAIQIRKLRQRADECRALAGKCDVEIAKQNAEIERLERELREKQQRYEQLVKDEILLRAETGTDGNERLNRLLAEQRQEEATLATRIGERREHKDRLAGQKQSAELTATKEAEREREAQEKYDEAMSLRNQLESNPTLRQTLEVEEIDLESLTDASFTLVKETSNAFVDRIVKLRIAKLEDERAVHHLKNGGLLPPTRDVERLLEVLTPRMRAWSGWVYIAENATDCRATIERSPELALGVIVADRDFETARSIVRTTTVELETPVVLAPQSAFEGTEPTNCAVVGPSSDAHFDRSAGQQELLRRDTHLGEYDEKLGDANSKHKELADLESRLRAFRKSYLRGWFGEQQVKIESHRAARESATARSAQMGEEIKATERDILDAETSLDAVRKSVRDCERHLQLTVEYVNRYESKAESWRGALETSRRIVSEQQEDRHRHLNEAASNDQQLEESDGRLKNIRDDVARSELLLEQIEYRSGSDIKPDAGPIQQLRDDYLRLKGQYEEKVGEEGLLLAVRENTENARRERRKLDEYLDDAVTEPQVAEALNALDDPERAEQAKDAAHSEKTAAFSATGTSAQALERAETKLDKARKVCEDIGATLSIPDEQQPQDAEAAENAADTSEFEARELDTVSQDSLANAERAEGKKEESDKSVEMFNSCQDQVELLRRSCHDVMSRLSRETVSITESLAIKDNESRANIKQLDCDLEELKKHDSQLSERRQTVTSKVRQWVADPQFDQLQSQIIRQFRSCDESHFEEQADYFLEQLALRLKTIQEKLAEIDHNRDQLVKELQAIADDGHSVLRSTANQSRIPDSVPEFANSQFLTINMKWPDDPAEQRGRLAELVDELVDGDDLPSGIELIQKAVRRLARPIRVRVLNPDPNLKGQRLDIPDLAKFSGGERLTCAVLLYCTLAQLRARRRGIFRKPSGVLLLDNPIGSASRVSFINLQRDVARAMGIQLIYTTGVNDYEALRPLPNLIRLRNDRINRNNGQHVVEHDSDGQSIEAARVVRRETSEDADTSDAEVASRQADAR